MVQRGSSGFDGFSDWTEIRVCANGICRRRMWTLMGLLCWKRRNGAVPMALRWWLWWRRWWDGVDGVDGGMASMVASMASMVASMASSDGIDEGGPDGSDGLDRVGHTLKWKKWVKLRELSCRNMLGWEATIGDIVR